MTNVPFHSIPRSAHYQLIINLAKAGELTEEIVAEWAATYSDPHRLAEDIKSIISPITGLVHADFPADVARQQVEMLMGPVQEQPAFWSQLANMVSFFGKNANAGVLTAFLSSTPPGTKVLTATVERLKQWADASDDVDCHAAAETFLGNIKLSTAVYP